MLMSHSAFEFGPSVLPIVASILSVSWQLLVGATIYRLATYTYGRRRAARRAARRIARIAHDETIRRFGSDGRRRLNHNTMSARTAMTRVERCRL